MDVDDGTADDSGDVPFLLVVACGSDFARYRRGLRSNVRMPRLLARVLHTDDVGV